MDARERLRRYLEQRRELGESELVLDSLSVDDVLSMLGARASARADAPAPRVSSPSASAAVPPAPRPSPSPAPATPPSVAPAASAPVEPPALPARRFDTAATGDWRDALRQAEAPGPNGDASRPPVPPTVTTATLPAWLAALELTAGVAVAPAKTASPAASDGVAGLDEALTLDDVASLIRGCSRCALHGSARQSVPGEGNPHADVVCVGEAPGASEDEQGRPFVGEAGQLLTKILSAIELARDDVYICNVLKHRPPSNRDPLPDEVTACRPFLERQLTLIKPRVIIALGRFAAQTLLQTTQPLGRLREQIHLYHGIPVIVTYHPAALLRNEAWKRPTWSDVKLARRILDASRAFDDRARGSAS